MTLDLFYSRAGHLIRRMNQISVAIFLEETAELGLTTVQYAALNMIEEVPDIDQVTLSNRIAFDTTTLVKVLDRLVEKGLITRKQSSSDRRRHVLNVTPKGREVVRKIIPMIDRCEQRILAPLGSADRRKFLELASRVVDVNNVYSRAPLKSDPPTTPSSSRKRTVGRRAGAVDG
ncbi:MAG: MarR family winged helix-turn-helix transcriptional regulator [Xanthobacteraceae bacterium]|nr:MarR family winged helix-turn-helix transcriptional regulator [Xanthobacteraceae bacterium]